MEIFGDSLPISKWASVSLDLLSVEDRESINYRARAIILYSEGCTVGEIKRQTGVSGSLVNYLLKRCLSLHSDGQIWGFRALVPNARIKAYTRSEPIKPKLPEAQGGHAGALNQLLQKYPKVEEEMVAWVKKKKKGGAVHEHRIRSVDLHLQFLNLLKELDVKNTEWPFNTKHLGRRTLSKYMNEILESDFSGGISARENSAARAHLNVGRGKSPLLHFSDPFDAVEIDAYHIDAHLTVGFRNPRGIITQVVLSRLWLLALVERASTAVLAYSVVYRSEVGASDVVYLLARAVSESWKPLNLTLGDVAYLPGSGMPNGVIPALSGAAWGSLLLDGALAHLSEAVRERARRKLGISINWGPVKHFERRPNVERLFGSIRSDIFGRLPSTTGSNPQNGRAEKGELLAETFKIQADEADQLVDVYIARHNSAPSEGIFNISPLEYLRQTLDNDHFMPRKLPRRALDEGPTFPIKFRATVRGGKKTGRRPYIQFLREHYTSDLLANSFGLFGKSLTLEIDEHDLRQLKAFLPNGECIGYLTAVGKWRLSKHDIKTRKAINGLLANRSIILSSGRDPVQAYLDYLSVGKKKNNLKTEMVPAPTEATEAVRVARSAGAPLVITNSNTPITPTSPSGEKPFRTLMPKPMPDLDGLVNGGGD